MVLIILYSFLVFAQVHEWMAIANFILLVFVVSMLIGLSVFLEKKKKFIWHGNVMLVAVMIASLLAVVHMGYSFIFVVIELLGRFNWVAFLGLIHGFVGLSALLLGIWLVGVWAIGESSELRFCAPKKGLMRKILILWAVALALGIIYYPLHFLLS
jgi:hypothetical protein